MKSFRSLSVVALVVSGWITSYAQEIKSVVPGDNFSLEGALELFKKSESPEEFEKMLNSADSKVNNLDLNGDGYIDYIRVFDKYEGKVHAFIIQAVVSETENQDVAVIELEKLSNGKAVLQIIGDEDIYGVTTIIEPTREVRTYAGSTAAPATIVNVWAWPSVQYVYGPYYGGWSSPWGYHRRPIWYRAWRPVAYVHYYPIWRPYRNYYATCYTRRVSYAHHIYRPYRTSSVYVRNRHHDQVERYRSTRNDDSRNGRNRNDSGRSYANNDRRDDANLNGRSSRHREAVSLSNPSNSRDRSMRNDIQRNSGELKRDESPNRRSVTVPNSQETRRQVTSPSVNRSRSIDKTIQQRSVNPERNVPTDLNRRSSELKRTEAPTKRSATVPNNQQTRRQMPAPTVNRSRSIESPAVQQQRSAPRERSAPTNIQRNSSGAQRDYSPNRNSGAVQNNRESRPQVSSPSVNRSRSSGSPAVQQRTGGTRSGETKRGRD